MRSTLFSSVVVLTLALAGAAFADPTDTGGKISAIDTEAMTLTLEDGSVYSVTDAAQLDGLKVGDDVTVTWEAQGDKNVASEIATN